jgi:hypothetical protein
MSSTWNLIEHALNEASGKGALLAHIRRFKGDHEADMLAPFLDSMWNAQGLPGLAKHLVARYENDPMVKSIFDSELTRLGVGDQSSRPAVMKRSAGSDKAKQVARSKPGAGSKSGKKVDDPQPQQFRTPDQVAAQKAATTATAASRPDRMGSKGNVPSRPMVPLKPGEKPTHDVGQSVRGTSPGHTKQPIDQPSVVMQPSKLAAELKPLEDRALSLKKMITVDLQHDPTKKPQLAKAKKDLEVLQQQIATIKHTGQSGVEDAQREVDRMSKKFANTAPHIADDMALQYGVPTTKQRTRKMIDPETGKEKLDVQIWDQEKVYRFMNKGATSQSGNLRIKPELEPGVYDAPPAAHPIKPNAMQGQSTPVVDVGAGKAATQKPMMKAPKGMDKAGLALLSKLKFQLKKVQDSGDMDRANQLARQVDQMMKSGGEIIDVVRPGTKDGQRWRNSVWNGNDWVLDSQAIAQAGDAASKPPA